MKFIFDENMGHQIPEALRCFRKDTYHVSDLSLAGKTDVEILRYCGANDYFFITKDKRMRVNKEEKRAIIENNVGVFFIVGQTQSAWYWVRLIINHWERVEKYAADNVRPFVVKLPSLNGSKIEAFDLP